MHHIRANLEMDSHDEKLHDMIMATKMNEARDQMKRKAKAIRQQKRDSARSSTRADRTGFGGGFGSESGGAPGGSGGFGSESGMGGGMSGGMSGGMGRGMGGGSSQADFFQSQRQAAPAASTIAIPKKAGMQLGARKSGKSKTSAFLAQMSKEEGIDVSAQASQRGSSEATRGAPQQAAPGIVAMPLMLLAREELTIRCSRDGGLKSLDLKGFLFLTANAAEASSPVVTLAQGENALFQVRHESVRVLACSLSLSHTHTHTPPRSLLNNIYTQCQGNPHIDRKMWSRNSVVQSKSASRELLALGKETSVLRWRLQGSDMSAKEALLPLVINCWPESNRGSMNVNVEYSLERPDLELSEVVITIPLGGSGAAPQIVNQDGDRYHHDAREGLLQWHMDMIGADNDVS